MSDTLAGDPAARQIWALQLAVRRAKVTISCWRYAFLGLLCLDGAFLVWALLL